MKIIKTIKSTDTQKIKALFSKLYIPPLNSHKGQNGKLLVIGGSSLFHGASIWAAEIASYVVDMVHYSSTVENNQIMLSLKKKFQNGIIVPRNQLDSYVNEDDSILIGSGMIRKEFRINNLELRIKNKELNLNKITKLKDEAMMTYQLVNYLINNHSNKQWVLDAGALQMMEKEWLSKLKQPIITPHQQEFKCLFGIDISKSKLEDKIKIVEQMALKYETVILLKAVVDIISDGKITYTIKGGNSGLTKGGTGDLLAGLVAAISTRNPPLLSTVCGSLLLKMAADRLFSKQKYWYNIENIIQTVPQVWASLI